MGNFVRKLSWKSNNIAEQNNNVEIQLKGGTSSEEITKETCLSKFKNYLISNIQVETSYLKFGIVFITGIIIIILSLFFLPLILITPKKFALLFALGTFVSLSSFIFYYGTIQFFELLFNKDRVCFTVVYLTGFFGCLFFPTFFGKNYFIILAFSGLEMISTLFFILTFLPGGYSSIRMFTNLFLSQIKRIFNQ